MAFKHKWSNEQIGCPMIYTGMLHFMLRSYKTSQWNIGNADRDQITTYDNHAIDMELSN